MDVLTLLSLALTQPGAHVRYHTREGLHDLSLLSYTDHALCAAVWSTVNEGHVQYDTAEVVSIAADNPAPCTTCYGKLVDPPKRDNLKACYPSRYAYITGEP